MAFGTLLGTGSVEGWDRLSSVRFPSITEKKAGSLFGGLAVVVLRDVRIRLLEETDVRVADALADELGADARTQRTGCLPFPRS